MDHNVATCPNIVGAIVLVRTTGSNAGHCYQDMYRLSRFTIIITGVMIFAYDN